jgi:hypothetical protein
MEREAKRLSGSPDEQAIERHFNRCRKRGEEVTVDGFLEAQREFRQNILDFRRFERELRKGGGEITIDAIRRAGARLGLWPADYGLHPRPKRLNWKTPSDRS